MPQYPISNQQGLVDSINYLLSGPAGLGQSFDGSYTEGLITPQAANMTQAETWATGNLGNFQEINALPVTPKEVIRYKDYLTPTDFYYPGISTLPGGLAISNITSLSDSVIEITYTPTVFTNYTQSPFVNGQRVEISGVTPTDFNGTYVVINYQEPGEFAAPSTTVELLTDTPQTWPTYTSGGIAEVNTFSLTQQQYIPTSAQAFVTVNGRDQRVFLSAQSTLDFYTYVKFVDIVAYQPIGTVNINRYRAVERTTLPDNFGTNNYTANNERIYNGFRWQLDGVVVSRPFLLDWDSIGSEVKVNNLGLQIFNNIIDRPEPNYYWYILEIGLEVNRDAAPNDGAILPVGLRSGSTLSFAAQVVKQ